jgi:hypothetical protein
MLAPGCFACLEKSAYILRNIIRTRQVSKALRITTGSYEVNLSRMFTPGCFACLWKSANILRTRQAGRQAGTRSCRFC